MFSEFNLTDAERTATPRRARPSQKKPNHLPQSIKPKTPRHHRITLKMARKEPEVRFDIQFGNDLAFAVSAAIGSD